MILLPQIMMHDQSITTAKAKMVWILDDDEAILEAIKIIIEEGGYCATSFSNASSFINQLKEERPDVILLDIFLSGEDGRTICKYLKNRHETREIPIILMSASSQLEKDVVDSNADSYIKKPFDIDTLLSEVIKQF